MGKKSFCPYCSKFYARTHKQRLRHQSGSSHRTNYKQYWAEYHKGIEERYKEILNKQTPSFVSGEDILAYWMKNYWERYDRTSSI